MCEKFHQLLAVGRWLPPGTPVSSTRKLISSSFHRLDMTLAVVEALNPNKTNKKTINKNSHCAHPRIFTAHAVKDNYSFFIFKLSPQHVDVIHSLLTKQF